MRRGRYGDVRPSPVQNAPMSFLQALVSNRWIRWFVGAVLVAEVLIGLVVGTPEVIRMVGQPIGWIEEQTPTPTPLPTFTPTAVPTPTAIPTATATPTVTPTPTPTVIPTATPTPDSICYDVRGRVSAAGEISDDFKHDESVWRAVRDVLPYECFDASVWAASRAKLLDWNTFILRHVVSCAIFRRNYESAKLAAHSMRNPEARSFQLAEIFRFEYDPTIHIARLGIC